MKTKLFIILFGLVVLSPALVLAQNKNTNQRTNANTAAATGGLPQYNRGVDTSIRDFLCTPTEDGNDLPRCINRIYRFGITIGAIALVFFVVWAGYMYMVGGETAKTKAKGMISNSMLGIGLLLGSYVLLRFINPSLVAFRPIQPPIFDAKLPTCAEVGFEADCVVDAGRMYYDTSKTGNLGPCKGNFPDEASAKAEMETFQVDTWNESGKSQKRTITVQKCIAQKTKAVFAAIYASPEKFPIKVLESFNYRRATGSTTKLSAHGMGLALDINDNENYFICNTCSPKTVGSYWKPCPATGCSPLSMPESGSVVKAFKAQGFGWGGNWNSLKDYMHFSCYPSEQGKCF